MLTESQFESRLQLFQYNVTDTVEATGLQTHDCPSSVLVLASCTLLNLGGIL